VGRGEARVQPQPGPEGPRGGHYLKLKLHRAVERGELRRIRRGLYTAHTDPLIYATHVVTPSYASLWTALRHYDLTTQTPTKIHVMAPEHHPDLDEIVFHRTNDMFGYRKKNYRGFEITVAEKEKLLLDCLSRREVPVSEVVELVEAVEIDRLLELAEKTGKESLKKRAGYLVERIRGERLESLKSEDRNYPLLDLSGPDGGGELIRELLREKLEPELTEEAIDRIKRGRKQLAEGEGRELEELR